jgi:hypothetical protein
MAVLVKSLAYGVTYMLLHELGHYIGSRLVGCRASFSLNSDGVVPAPSVNVSCASVGVLERVVVLYMPYLFNIVFVLYPLTDPILKLIALFTLPNMFLEVGRSKRRLLLSALSTLVLIAVVEATYR